MYFDNIIGQDFAKKYLTNSIKKNKINHAYMFEGIDGIGKKKLSQELSKILLDTENVENSPDYIRYGARGISVCREWLNFTFFKEWAIANGYSDELTLDRINNNRGYCPENCRWTSKQVQSNNTRRNK